MANFRILKGLSNEMDGLIGMFWWESKPSSNRFFALKAWKDICKPKKLGGLGFHRFKYNNSAMLAKLGSKLTIGEESLRTKLLKAKYRGHKSFLECRPTNIFCVEKYYRMTSISAGPGCSCDFGLLV